MDELSIAVWLVKESTEKGTRVGLEVSMTFAGISPAGRLIAVLFVAVILIMLLYLFIKRGGNM